MHTPAVILHLSDLQFGVHHRFVGKTLPSLDSPVDPNARYGSDDAFKTLFAKLDDDLAILKSENGLAANILVISGDLAEWSLENEYQAAREFVEALLNSKNADLTRERMVLVPGNHDINWSLSEAHFLECKARRIEPQPPYTKALMFWMQFLTGALGVASGVASQLIWQKFDFREYGLLCVGLNSCIKESHRPDDHYGWIGMQQAKEATDWLEATDPHHVAARCAIWHHNAVRGSGNDEENLQDWDALQRLMEKSVDLILHGHRHDHYRTQLGSQAGKPVLILGAGSAGLDGQALPACPNQYQIIRIEGSQVSVYLRSYTGTGGGGFRADADASARWFYSFPLPKVFPDHGAADSPAAVVGLLPRAIEDLRSSVRRAIDERLQGEEERVGALLRLDCRDVRSQSTASIDPVLERWLEAPGNQQLVILGAAGSGKTVTCLKVCSEVRSRADGKKWLPLYLDLGRFAAADDALEIVAESLRSYGLPAKASEVLEIFKSSNLLICLDSFDEYEKSDLPAFADRSFSGFAHLRRPNIKLLITCRSNFFHRPEDVFVYELRTRDFELCPASAAVVELLPLSTEAAAAALQPHVEDPIPDWLCSLTDRPLYLRMLIPLLRAHAIDISRGFGRPELYERFVTFVLQWDLARRRNVKITLDESRRLHVALAERFLANATGSLRDIELFRVVEQVFGRTDERFYELVLFFKESGLLRFEADRIVYSHKSFREYLVAKRIVDLIAIDDTAFGFTWFTRHERDFIVQMIDDADKQTLSRWLANESVYPACNYASFILGGTGDKRMVPHLKSRLRATSDALVKVNCANALAALGDEAVRTELVGAVAGYALAEGLCTIPPSGAEKAALEWMGNLTEKFGRPVMLIHLCETIDALAACGDEEAVRLLKQLEMAPDKTVVDEAKGAIRRLVNRLGDTVPIGTAGVRRHVGDPGDKGTT